MLDNDFTIDNTAKRITLLIEGEYSAADIRAYFDKILLYSNAEELLQYDQLFIYQHAVFVGDNKDIVELAELRAQYDLPASKRRLAMVYLPDENNSTHAGDVYKEARQIIKDSVGDTATFESTDEAIRWLESER